MFVPIILRINKCIIPFVFKNILILIWLIIEPNNYEIFPKSEKHEKQIYLWICKFIIINRLLLIIDAN